MMHELGHNFGNSHAYESDNEYDDESTVMGYASRATNLCFNGQNVWRMGWFLDRRIEIDNMALRGDYNHNGPEQRFVQLAFYGDYEKTVYSQPVVAKIGNDVFLTYNRKKGINNETNEYADRLLVVQERINDDGNPYSNLVDAIPRQNGKPFAFTMEGGYYSPISNNNNTNNNNLIVVEVCGYNKGDDNGPEFLTVAIGNYYGGCDEYDEDEHAKTQNSPESQPPEIHGALPTSTASGTTNKVLLCACSFFIAFLVSM